MDREKFDCVLKNKVQEFEQKYTPAFDEDKVWKNIKKDDNKNRWFQIVASAAIVILGLSILFQQFLEPVEVAKRTKPKLSDKVFQIPLSKTKSLAKLNESEKYRGQSPDLTPEAPGVFNDIKQSIIAITEPDNTLHSADLIQPQPVVIEPIKIKISELPLAVEDEETEIKVTFRRGKSVNAELPVESKLSFRKFRLKIFENQTYDTSAYASGVEAEPERKFRINF